ncbi:DUF998 domain-containing protein [Micromonospora zingiberis]|uniref:DUF998 domain-containing protein n=1 Tax=Micromonospora zingiberis TaxID=2053011 RepID=A0A4R0GKD9_9ACTN|nr:DUF998 domain-containing protein [Micromonospora zingiberis]
MLANGPFGWVHSANLMVSGALVVAGAAGLYPTLRSRTAAALLGLYGAGMVGAGIFRADPGPRLSGRHAGGGAGKQHRSR